MSERLYHIVSGLFFAIVALAHAFRVVVQAGVVVDTMTIPQWMSVAAAVATAALSVWAFATMRRRERNL
jgi:hypothetical protein